MGVGVVEGRIGAPMRMVAAGVLRSPADAPIAERLLALEGQVEQWLDEHAPDAVAVERMFAQEGVRTIMGTAQAAGVAMVAAARRGLPVALHTPSEGGDHGGWARAEGTGRGHGRADPEA
jgi:crossover junction endodeoxyribonuclease RuvC